MAITGTSGNDLLPDTSGNDTIIAQSGFDEVTISGGADTADGGAGDDTLTVDYSASSTAVTMAAPTLTGPVIEGYPAPGGTTFSATGTGTGNAGGRTGTYTGFDTTQYDSLWWGPNSVHAFIQGTGDGEMTFSSISEDGLTATFIGTASVTSLDYTGPVFTKYVVTILAGSSGWVEGSDPSGPDVLALINSGTFQINQQFLVSTSLNGTYLPLNDWYNDLNASNVGGTPIQTNVVGQFVYDDGGFSGTIDDGNGNSVSFTDFEALNISSGTGADTLYGAGGNDTLRSASGDDILHAGGGDDWIEAGLGNDTIDGGAGTDTATYENASGAVQVDLAAGTATGAEGSDTLIDMENLVGSAYADRLIGNSANNNIQGGSSGDILEGGGGDDILDGGNGSDGVRYVNATGAVVVDLAAGTATGDGSDTLISIEAVTGSAFNDTLTGNDANNILSGGAGADTMSGGLGNDQYWVDDAGDVVSESGGGGTDEVRSSISFTLGSGLENLVLTGSANINGTGNGLDNTLWGNSGNNVLNGGGGADSMRGGTGNDTYIVNASGDRAIETVAIGGGTDTVKAGVSFLIGGNIENLVLTGAAAIDGTGNALANSITGNGADNALSGLDGADTLSGLDGIDRLNGGAGDDLLNGGNGNDFLEGGAGADRMIGGAGADFFVFRDGDIPGLTFGIDRITDFSHADGDRIRLNYMDANSANGNGTNETFAFIGTSAFNHVAGELRYQEISGNTFVYGDTDGDGTADFTIRVDGSQAFVAADFVL